MDSADKPRPEPIKTETCRAPALDAAKFAALLDRGTERIHAYVASKVRNRETAHELVQQALSKAWSSRLQFDPNQDELAWLISIASHVIADHVKSIYAQKRQPESGQKAPRGDGRFPAGPTLDSAASSTIDPLSRMIDAERILAVDAAIAQLEESKRQVIEFCRAGLSYEEIASRMELPVGTVGSLRCRAIKELKAMLGTRII